MEYPTAMTAYQGGGLVDVPCSPRQVSITEMIAYQLKEAENRVEKFMKLQILFKQNPAIEETLNLMRSLQIG